jgi:hypothetical protein
MLSASLIAVSGFQLAASLVSALAWPVFVMIILLLAWIKRAPIADLITSRSIGQGRALRRLRAGPIEIEWDQLIESTAEKVLEASPREAPVADAEVSQELATIADSIPAAAVLEAFARVEHRLREITADINVDTSRRRARTVGTMARLAFLSGLITEEILGAIYNLTRLRNEAAHRVGEADITSDQAHDYLQLVDRVLRAMQTAEGKNGASGISNAS